MSTYPSGKTEIVDFTPGLVKTLHGARIRMPVNSDGDALNLDELAQWIQERQAEAASQVVSMGIGFSRAKNLLARGDYIPWLAARGFSDRTVRRYIKIADSFFKYPPQVTEKVAKLSITKMECLSIAPLPVVLEMLEEGRLDDAESQTNEEFKSVVKLKRNEEKLEAARDEAITAKEQKERHDRAWIRSPLAEGVREESKISADIIINEIANLSGQLNHISEDRAFNLLPVAEIELAIETLIISINGVAAHVSQLIDKAPTLPDTLPAFAFEHQFSTEQVDTMVTRLHSLVIETSTAKDLRDIARQALAARQVADAKAVEDAN